MYLYYIHFSSLTTGKMHMELFTRLCSVDDGIYLVKEWGTNAIYGCKSEKVPPEFQTWFLNKHVYSRGYTVPSVFCRINT